MLDKTIDSALLKLRRQIIRGGLDGLDHFNALLVQRGIVSYSPTLGQISG